MAIKINKQALSYLDIMLRKISEYRDLVKQVARKVNIKLQSKHYVHRKYDPLDSGVAVRKYEPSNI